MPRTPGCAEKSELSAVCGEILAPAAFTAPATDEDLAVGLRAMNMLRIPKVLPTPGSRKRRDKTQGPRLELTLEAPSHRPPAAEKGDELAREPERGIAEIDFFI